MTPPPRDPAASEATMKGPRENRPSRPVGSQGGGKAHRTDAPPQESRARPTLIRVRCPNAACGKIYTVRSSLAGQHGHCRCGAIFLIPNVRTPRARVPAAPVRARASDEGTRRAEGEGGPRPEVDLRAGENVTEVYVGCIGRGHAGKTALLRTLGEGPVGDFFPSGLHVDARDPREVAQRIREAEETQRLLHLFGLPPTLKRSEERRV